MLLEAAAVGWAAGEIAPLVAQFLRERANEHGAVTEAAFRQWLQDEAFPKLLQQSGQALQAIVSMKATETERYAKLEALLQEIRIAVTPTKSTPPALSPQAISILAQVIESGTTEMIECGNLDGPSYLLVSEHSLVFDAPAFLADDLDELVRQRYLSLDYNAQGKALYKPTRDGAAYITGQATPAA